MQLGLRNIEGGLRRRLIACLDRALDILDECAHAAQTRTVDDGALLGLPKTLLGGFVVRHRLSSKGGSAAYIGAGRHASTAARPPPRPVNRRHPAAPGNQRRSAVPEV